MPSVQALEQFIARVESNAHVEAVLVDGDRVAIRWIFQFDWLDGTRTRMEEIARQRWEGDRIAEEIFFYDPAQRTPKPA